MPIDLSNAIAILKRGGVVAFPTETVYGLGADARDESAVRRVFELKSRPMTNPCIVHVADVSIAQRYAATWPDAADQLAKKFWPGALTIVLPKSAEIPGVVTADLNNVGLRCPDHPLALQLLNEFDGPLVGPSANRSTRISPTTADHVREEFGDAIELILDGGPCKVGIESTVVDLSSDAPKILRPGAITAKMLAEIIGEIKSESIVANSAEPMPAPGQMPVHYAPHTPTFRMSGDESLQQWMREHPGQSVMALLLGSQLQPSENLRVMRMPADAARYAAQMYSALRSADSMQANAIWVELPPNEPQWTAVRDRLSRATREA